MASIRENRKKGKVVSYQFTAFLERNAAGKQVRKYLTWTPPESLSPAKARKAAQREADKWEAQIRADYQKEQEAASAAVYSLPPEERRDDFFTFVNDVWLTLQVRGGGCKPATIAFYEKIAKVITAYFDGCCLQEITPVLVQKYLNYLRTEYVGANHKPLGGKSVRHHYVTLNTIFRYAERQGMIVRNPMLFVDAPKREKKPVDALTPEQARLFFDCLPSCPLNFRCMLLLLITTGIRRGECMGLKWGDIDEKERLIHIERNVSYTPKSGVQVLTPKTATSIRAVPI